MVKFQQVVTSDFSGGPVIKTQLPVKGVRAPTLVGKVRLDIPHGQKAPEHNRSNIVANSVKTLKMVPVHSLTTCHVWALMLIHKVNWKPHKDTAKPLSAWVPE